jgi:pimeloyl-ACP methyl ester carboxylesterase
MEDSSISVVSNQATLYGTLELPAHSFPVPVALIIAGSGPTDRNGNSRALPGANNSLRYLARGLAERGIASIRYDKRGIGASAAAMGKEQDLRFDHFVGDAKSWIAQLRSDPRFSTITVVGHSEGSLIGMIAAREAGADAFVSLEGAGRNAKDVIAAQLSTQLPENVVNNVKDMMRKIEAGEKIDSVPPMLAPLLRPSVQPYLASWFKYTPSSEIAKLTVPSLVVQGTTDIQTSVEDAKLLADGHANARLFMIEGMNHVLKAASGNMAAQMPSYSDPALPVVPQLLDEVATFIKSARKR